MQSNPIPVAILGGTGYTGLELFKIFLRHEGVRVVAVTSRQDAGKLVSESHPQLTNRTDLRFEEFDPAALKAKGVQCVFGCLPHGASMASVPPLLALGMKVIDLSADYRLRDSTVYETWYKEPHHDAANLAHAVYGVPELNAERIRTATLIANPGCYPQTAILGLAPLVAKRLIDPTTIIVDAKSGVSGAGRTPKLGTLYPECNESVSAYGIGTHRHTPEIDQALTLLGGEPVNVIFTPHLMPMDRGILSTIYATPREPITLDRLKTLYADYYKGQPFVRLRTSPPATKDTTGTNFLDVYPTIVQGRIIVVAVEDNLIRGASGVAVQNFNLMYGFDERTGLN